MSDHQGGVGPEPQGYGPPGQGAQEPVAHRYGAERFAPAYQVPAPPLGVPAYGPPPLPEGVAYAAWGLRALALVVDSLLLFACLVPGIVIAAIAAAEATPGQGPTAGIVLALVVLFVGGILVWLFQYCWLQGARGQSWGKQVTRIHLVRETDLLPPGGGVGVARYVLRSVLGQATCGVYTVLTLLWPLWDAKHQTLDDKIVHTLVVRFAR
jgi:uncharacterized RDD family membrane protein YckC